MISRAARAAVCVLPVVAAGLFAVSAGAAPARPASGTDPGGCPPSGVALSYSDALDKISYHGAELGGLSSLAWDPVARVWRSAVDNDGSEPARVWSFASVTDPVPAGAPLVLRAPDGTPYTGLTADDEGLAILPDGRLVVSSETGPSIRIYDRRGVQQSQLPVPTRFLVAPAGQATANATLEGLTVTPSGHRLIAAMEGTLAGDTGDGTYRRFLVYDEDAAGTWTLTRQIGYRVQPGNRVPEVAAYGENSFVVEEAAFSTTTGNSVSLWAVTGLDAAPDISAVPDLAHARRDVVAKSLVADVTRCPTLGAPSRETQTNPLLDNYEGMAFTADRAYGYRGLTLISDDNFSATQTTRLLNLLVRLP